MKQIPLYKTDGTISDHAMVDDQVYDDVNRFRWYKTHYGYAARGFSRAESNDEVCWMHRFIYEAHVGPITGDHLDHIDRNRLNNTLVNLRCVSTLQNNLNRTPQEGTQTGYTGVSVDRRGYRTDKRIRYQAHTSVNDRSVNICYADTARDAAIARDIYLQRLYPGEIIVLNVPDVSPEEIGRVAAMLDKPKQRSGISQYVGVSYDKRRGHWYAHIKINYKDIYLGRHDTEQEAAKAYDNYCRANALKRRLNFNDTV